MRKLIAALAIVGASFPASVAAFAGPTPHVATYALGTAKKCHVDYVKRTERHKVAVRVKVKGVWKSGQVNERYVACVWDKPAPVATATASGATVGDTATGSTSSHTGTARASLDPAYTQNPSNPLDVTFTYSASDTDGQLPNGVLDLYWGTTTQSQTLACSMNVGGNVAGGTCEVVFPSYGGEIVTVQYVSGTTSATQTDAEDIENPNPAPVTTTTQPPVTTTTLPPPHVTMTIHGPATAAIESAATFTVTTIGNVNGDAAPAGTLNFQTSGPAPASEFDQNTGSILCNVAHDNVGNAEDACTFKFPGAGTYTIDVSYNSSDANYQSVSDAASTTVTVS